MIEFSPCLGKLDRFQHRLASAQIWPFGPDLPDGGQIRTPPIFALPMLVPLIEASRMRFLCSVACMPGVNLCDEHRLL